MSDLDIVRHELANLTDAEVAIVMSAIMKQDCALARWVQARQEIEEMERD